MNTPILVLAFNRVEHLKRCIRSLENLENLQNDIYVSIDGPREQFPEETSKVVDYAKSLLKENRIASLRISEKNGGTLHGILGGIDWFFESVAFGLVLEDDLVIAPSLLEFIKQVKSQFLGSEIYSSVCMYNVLVQDNSTVPNATYRESKLFSSLAWCTSATNWNQRRSTFLDLKVHRIAGVLFSVLSFTVAVRYLIEILENRRKEVESVNKCNWDLYWEYTCWERKKLNLLLNYRVVDHTGWDLDSTHQMPIPSYYKSLDFEKIPFRAIPLISRSREFNNFLDQIILKDIRRMSGMSFLRHLIRIRSRIKSFSLKIR